MKLMLHTTTGGLTVDLCRSATKQLSQGTCLLSNCLSRYLFIVCYSILQLKKLIRLYLTWLTSGVQA